MLTLERFSSRVCPAPLLLRLCGRSVGIKGLATFEPTNYGASGEPRNGIPFQRGTDARSQHDAGVGVSMRFSFMTQDDWLYGFWMGLFASASLSAAVSAYGLGAGALGIG